MTSEQFRREILFLASMELLKVLFNKCVISKSQYEEIQRKIAEKYRPPIVSLSLTY